MREPLTVEQAAFGPDYRFSRLLRGGWQLAGGHGDVDQARAVADMFAFVDAGVTAFDCADIYTGVEELIGAFRAQLARQRGDSALRQLKVHTKFVPDWDQLGSIRRDYVEGIIDRSLKRLRTERLDLVQFHWWNYEADGMIETALMLKTWPAPARSTGSAARTSAARRRRPCWRRACRWSRCRPSIRCWMHGPSTA